MEYKQKSTSVVTVPGRSSGDHKGAVIVTDRCFPVLATVVYAHLLHRPQHTNQPPQSYMHTQARTQ